MKRIILFVYQSIDGCPARPDKQVEEAIENADYLLTDGDTYLDVWVKHLGWPLTHKETYVVTKVDCNLTEGQPVHLLTGDALAEIKGLKETGEGVIVAYGREIAALLLSNGLADEIVMTTVPEIAGGYEKALPDVKTDDAMWVVRTCTMLNSGKVRTVFGRV